MEFLYRINKVIDYIEEHLTEDFDLNEVAEIVGCNAYQFGRIFSYNPDNETERCKSLHSERR